MHYLKANAMPVSRSLLFVPGNRPDRFDKAAASPAQDVILDLEDAVEPAAKDMARAAIAGWQGTQGAIIRINGADSPWFAEDITFARGNGLRRLMIPKAEPSVVTNIREALTPDIEIIALIETVAGLLNLRALCAGGGRLRLAFGNLDFALDSGVTETAGELDSPRLQLTLESRFAGLEAPIDGVCPAISDETGLAREVQRARALGMGGKLCIHPAQTRIVNEGWRPAAAETAWAERVLSAVEASGSGVVSLDGKMVDRPVIERARQILSSGR